MTSPPPTRILLSFSSAYSELARRIGNDLNAANIQVRYDQWEGGGGVSSSQAVAQTLDDAAFLLPLLTPSDAAPTWIDERWRSTIYDPACARGITVLPIRGQGDLSAVPEFVRDRSFANLRDREYQPELRRLVETIRNKSGDSRIILPSDAHEAHRNPSLPTVPLALKLGKELEARLDHTSLLGEMIPMMREGLFFELGVKVPSLQLLAGPDLPPNSAQIVINDIPEFQIELHPGSVMVNETVQVMAELGISGKPAINPANDAPCAWIPAHQARAASERGLTTWDAAQFLILSLSAVLRRKASHFIGIDQAHALLTQIQSIFPQLVAETVPKTVSLFVFTDVLRRLLAELISIRDLRRILMALADWGRIENDPLMLTEYARAALRRQLTHQLSRGTRQLIVFLLHPEIERIIRESIRYTATASYVDIDAIRLGKIIDAIATPVRLLPKGVQIPQILTPMEIRSSIRRLVAPSMPWLHVVSYHELRPDADLQPIARISLDGFTPRQATVDGVPLWRTPS